MFEPSRFKNLAFSSMTLVMMIALTFVQPQGRAMAQQDQQEEPNALPEKLESDQSEEKAGSRSEDESPKKAALPKPIDIYMGRRIAQTMHYTGAEWLIRDVREREERCSMMLANLGVKRGMTVCDMGCGNGFHTIPIAELVGPKGQVIGVDVQPEMLSLLRDRVEDRGVENVIPILGSFHNPRLPDESVDLILMVDVYHEFSFPEQMLAAMRKALKPDGLIVLVEYRAEDKKVPIKKLHKMTKVQVNLEMEANGFIFAKEFDRLPWQHMMFFGKSNTETATESNKGTIKTGDAPKKNDSDK